MPTHEYFNEFIITLRSNLKKLVKTPTPDLDYEKIIEILKKPTNEINLLIDFIYRIKFLIDYSNSISKNSKYIPVQAKLLYSFGPNYDKKLNTITHLKNVLDQLDFKDISELQKVSWFKKKFPKGGPPLALRHSIRFSSRKLRRLCLMLELSILILRKTFCMLYMNSLLLSG